MTAPLADHPALMAWLDMHDALADLADDGRRTPCQVDPEPFTADTRAERREAVLHVTGRDITEADYGLAWDVATCTWSLLDEPVILATMGTTRRQILDWLIAHGAGTPSQIAEGTGIRLNTVQQNVRRMVTDQQLDSDGAGTYFAALSVSAPSVLSAFTDTADRTDTDTEGLIA